MLSEVKSRFAGKLSIAMMVVVLFAGYLKAQSTNTVKQKSNVQTVKMEELLKNPKSYEGKEVAVNGVFNSICCASDFVLKDGFDAMEVYVTDKCPMPDKSKVRSKVEVQGTVKVKGDEVTLIAKEVRFK